MSENFSVINIWTSKTGEFTRAQLEVYEAVLEVQEACIKLCSTDVSIELVFQEMLHMIGQQLLRLKVVPKQTQGMDLLKVNRKIFSSYSS